MKLTELNPHLRYAELQQSLALGETERASHDYRLFYIYDGEITFVCSDYTIDLAKGSIMFYEPHRFYRFIGDAKVIVLNFDLTRINDFISHSLHVYTKSDPEKFLLNEEELPEELKAPFFVHNKHELQQLFTKCVYEHRFTNPYSDALTSSIVKQILCEMLASRSQNEQEMPDIVKDAQMYMLTNYDQNIDNESVAQSLNYHSFYLNRVFKTHTGLTIHQFLIKVRIDNAKMLLQKTTLSVDEIQRRVGFQSRSQFYTMFERSEGITPKKYREGFIK